MGAEPVSPRLVPPTAMGEATFLEIPGGSYLMGDEAGGFDEHPVHQVRVAAFRLARFPVTNRQYAVYLDATGAAVPRFWGDSRFNVADSPWSA